MKTWFSQTVNLGLKTMQHAHISSYLRFAYFANDDIKYSLLKNAQILCSPFTALIHVIVGQSYKNLQNILLSAVSINLFEPGYLVILNVWI